MRAGVIVMVALVACGRGDSLGAIALTPVVSTLAPVSAQPLDVAMPGVRRPGAAIGSDGVATSVVASPDGRWVAFCQARSDTDGDGKVGDDFDMHGNAHGDRLDRYLVVDGGEGERVDTLLARDETGDRVVERRNGVLELLDLASSTVTPLPQARSASAADRVVARFSRDDATLVYASGDEIDVRSLAQGVTRSFQLPGALVGGIGRIDDRWLQVWVVDRDTDHDGELHWPGVESDRKPNPCGGAYAAVTSWGASGDEPHLRWIDLEHSEQVLDPAKLWPVGDRWIERASDGTITLDRVPLIQAACQATVFAVLASPLRVLYGCYADTHSLLHVVGEDGTAFDGYLLGSKPEDPLDEQIDLIVEGMDPDERSVTAYYRLTDGRMTHIDGRVVEVEHQSVLFWRDGWFRKLDLVSGVETDVAPAAELPRSIARTDTVFAFEHDRIIDFAAAKVLGTTPANTIRVDRTGRALVAASIDADDNPVGPLRWVAPSP